MDVLHAGLEIAALLHGRHHHVQRHRRREEQHPLLLLPRVLRRERAHERLRIGGGLIHFPVGSEDEGLHSGSCVVLEKQRVHHEDTKGSERHASRGPRLELFVPSW
jgi:hypothetical protein